MLSFSLAYWGQNFFVRFLGELKKPKSPFEINWPLAAAIIRDGHMPDMNFSTWNHACSKVHEILELEENIQMILFNISQSSVKSMLQMLSYAATLKFP